MSDFGWDHEPCPLCGKMVPKTNLVYQGARIITCECAKDRIVALSSDLVYKNRIYNCPGPLFYEYSSVESWWEKGAEAPKPLSFLNRCVNRLRLIVEVLLNHANRRGDV